ncbi:MAG: c-type cytochrome [Saprospiraceae bacterium]|nr:c-type cytochrome [Saprospiraceae bacterium]
MKRLLKISAYVLGSVVLLVAGVALFVQLRGIPDYAYDMPAHIASLEVPKDSAHVARGAVLGTTLCKACHLNNEGKLAGKMLEDIPVVFGTAASLNITKDPVHGIGAWTDGELYYLLRTGLRKNDGWAVFMPKFPNMSDDDVYSVIAWLRSNDPALEPDSREFPPNKPNFVVKALANFAIFPPALHEKPIVAPPASDKIAFGEYTANAVVSCFVCHSANMATNDEVHPELSAGFYGGGNPMLNAQGETVNSANITMDMETGIGKWTEQEFVDAVRYGKKPGGGMLAYPMQPHTAISEEEIKAIFAYLKTVPVISNKVERYK